jgi:hypothetical protein
LFGLYGYVWQAVRQGNLAEGLSVDVVESFFADSLNLMFCLAHSSCTPLNSTPTASATRGMQGAQARTRHPDRLHPRPVAASALLRR